MRDLNLLNKYRDAGPHVIAVYGSAGNGTCGTFLIGPPIFEATMRIIAVSGDGWDHVSASFSNRCPTWPEMTCVKGMFFKNDETVMQLHVPVDDHINCHPYCLHLWRPLHDRIPRPPSRMVG